MLEFFFTSTGRSSFAPCSEDEADAAVFDLDHLESRTHWERFHGRSGCPGIALSMVRQDVAGAVWVQKPVTPAALLAAAADIHARRWQPSAATMPTPVEVPVIPETGRAAAATEPVREPEPTSSRSTDHDVVDAVVVERAPLAPMATPVAAPMVVPPAAPVAPPPVVIQPAAVPRVVESAPGPARTPAAPVSRSPAPAPVQRGAWGFIKRILGRDEPSAPASAPKSSTARVERQAEPAISTHAPAPQGGVASSAMAVPPAAEPVPAAQQVASVATAAVPQSPALSPAATSVVAEVAGNSGAVTGSSLKGIQPVHALTPQEDARLCGAQDLTVAALTDDPGLRYDPSAYLVTALREAYLVSRKWQVPTRLDTDAGVITVDSVHNRIYLEFSEARLYQLCAAPTDKRPKTRTLGLQEAAAIRATLEQESRSNDLYLCRADATLWRAGLETARGRLPQGVNPGKTVYLKSWPNMTRLLWTPHALRVTALWATRGASLNETSSQLGVPLRYVLAVYNAALALDLVTEDGGHLRRAQRKTHRNRGFLTRLFTWLHK